MMAAQAGAAREVAETCALGVSTRKVGRALGRMGADRLSKDAASRARAALVCLVK